MKRPTRPNKPRRTIQSIDELPYICNSVEVGLLIRENPEQVNKLAREGILRGAKIGQSWRFRKDDVLAYLDSLFCGVM